MITAAVFPVYGYQPIILMGAGFFFALCLWAWVFPETKDKNLDTPPSDPIDITQEGKNISS
ncbi:hypothetical protein COJ85_09045 [Bacillus sp. AFS076308]|nr:hypothetical protein COJ85_09045 [Bacillus sp. AFS076308]PGV54158.1 hypothetical protein COD92_05850 [Bacillus sp. AFS037270]